MARDIEQFADSDGRDVSRHWLGREELQLQLDQAIFSSHDEQSFLFLRCRLGRFRAAHQDHMEPKLTAGGGQINSRILARGFAGPVTILFVSAPAGYSGGGCSHAKDDLNMSRPPRPFDRGPDPDAMLDRPRRQPPPGSAMLRAGGGRRGAQVACLPELFRTQYFCQVEDAARFDLAEPIPGPTTEALAEVARETAMVVVGSVFERRAAGVYHNTAVVLDADGTLVRPLPQDAHPRRPALLRKVLLHARRPGLPGVRDRASPGRDARLLGPVVSRGRPADRPQGRRDPLLSHGDRLAPGREGRVRRGPGDAWETIQRSHAIANGVYVAAVNRVGHEGPPAAASSSGAARSWPTPSAASSPAPATTPRKSSSPPATPALQEETRRNWPFLRDRRIDAYAPITQRFLDSE